MSRLSRQAFAHCSIRFSLFTFYFLRSARRPARNGPSFEGRPGRAFRRARPSPRVERDAECRLEDPGPRPRMVVAGHQQRTGLDHHLRHRRPRRVASRAGARCRERARARERGGLPARRTPISRTRRTATHPRRPSSKAIACMCTSAAKAPRRWTPCPGPRSGRRNFRMRRSTAPAAPQRSTAIC